MPEKPRVMLNNVLFATDFSPSSLAALPYAEAIARRYGAKLYIAHLYSHQGTARQTRHSDRRSRWRSTLEIRGVHLIHLRKIGDILQQNGCGDAMMENPRPH